MKHDYYRISAEELGRGARGAREKQGDSGEVL